MDINRIIDWVRTHRWETATAVLSTGLVVVVALLVLALDDSPVEGEAAVSTTTTPPESLAPSDSTSEDSDDQPIQGSGPFGEGTAAAVTAVVVDNVPDAGFQVGLDDAELLIETPVEGGLTRFTALYGDEIPDLIGPVRSLRPVSADLLALFAPVVFATGGQRFVIGAVEAVGATIVTPDVSIAFQSIERPQPHHIFVSPLLEQGEGTDVGSPWSYADWPGGSSVTEVSIPISGGITWRFEDGVYARYQGDEPHEILPDLDTDPQPLTRDTLILLIAHQKSAGYTDSAGADVPTFDVVGAGDLYVFHAGEMIEGRWFRANQAEGYTFTDTDGDPLPIPPGGLYLAIVPEDLLIEVGG